MVGGPRTPFAVSVLLLAGALLASCGGGGGDDEVASTPAAPTNGRLIVRAFEFGFEPDSILLSVGEQVTIVLQNDGRILHNLKSNDIPADVALSDSTGPLSAKEGEVFVGADGGVRGTLELTPLEAGTYAFYCTISGHEELGMEGTIAVQPAPERG